MEVIVNTEGVEGVKKSQYLRIAGLVIEIRIRDFQNINRTNHYIATLDTGSEKRQYSD
jgi:regulator of RNase E activity RraA